MTTRGEIMAYILTNPGVYLREISEDLGLSMGVIQYHTWVLTKNGEVEECRSGRYRRFFGARRYLGEERLIISLLRQGTTGRILVTLAGNEPLTHMTLARVLGISSQALSWQMKRLKETGIVELLAIQGQQERGYRLLESVAPIVRALMTQKPRVETNPVPVPAYTS
jgi:predicted transcriptional regulator